MDPRLLRHYNRELQHLRDMGGEFAKAFPKIAGRLGLDEFECADPYVERLLEGFAFLAARVQLKLDDEFREFTQHLLEIVYPHYLAPTPSMAIVRMQPDLAESTLAEGFKVERGGGVEAGGRDRGRAPEHFARGAGVLIVDRGEELVQHGRLLPARATRLPSRRPGCRAPVYAGKRARRRQRAVS